MTAERKVHGEMIKAPFTAEQVEALNQYQKSGKFHPFTCPGNLSDCAKHRDLIATTAGWVCACGKYQQYWAHESMMEVVALQSKLDQEKQRILWPRRSKQDD
jgi:hypothetical protein